jgi:hypothetical protein
MRVHVWYGGVNGPEGPFKGDALFNEDGTAHLIITDRTCLQGTWNQDILGPITYPKAERFNGTSLPYCAFAWSPIREEAVTLPDPMTSHGWETMLAAAEEGKPVSYRHCLGWFVISSNLKQSEHEGSLLWELTLGDGAGRQKVFAGFFLPNTVPGKKKLESRFDRDPVV